MVKTPKIMKDLGWPCWNRGRAQAKQALAGEAECRR
jgi:hypothetical protein